MCAKYNSATNETNGWIDDECKRMHTYRGASEVNEHYRWIDREMGAAKADPNVVWTAVVLHHPPFLDSQEKPWLLTKLHDMHVDMVFAGHDHFLEYTYLGRNEPIKYWG